MGVACGIGLSEKLKNSGKISAVFTGDGGTSQGDFHEALNLASVWKLPVIFAIENNGYGLSTPTSEQYPHTFVSATAGAIEEAGSNYYRTIKVTNLM